MTAQMHPARLVPLYASAAFPRCAVTKRCHGRPTNMFRVNTLLRASPFR